MPYVRLTIKVKVGIPESVKVGWYPHKITGSSHLNYTSSSVVAFFLTQCEKSAVMFPTRPCISFAEL